MYDCLKVIRKKPEKGLKPWHMGTSVWTIKRELEHLVEVRPTLPVRTAFVIINYFKCEISEKNIQTQQNFR